MFFAMRGFLYVRMDIAMPATISFFCANNVIEMVYSTYITVFLFHPKRADTNGWKHQTIFWILYNDR